jgi:hypothetical protein
MPASAAANAASPEREVKAAGAAEADPMPTVAINRLEWAPSSLTTKRVGSIIKKMIITKPFLFIFQFF